MGDEWGQVRISGLTELKNTLEALPVRLERNVIMGALRAAAQVIRKEAQANAPVLQKPHPYRLPGVLRKSITVRRSRKTKLGVYVGVRQLGGRQIAQFKRGNLKKAAQNPNDPYYWIFQEFGTRSVPAKRFLRNAFVAKRFEAVAKFKEYVARRLVREAEKLAREKGARVA